jgi:CheY-like chemotaxis protein
MSELERVLLVEDDPDVQTIGRMALETVGGLRVDVASSGEEALERLAASVPDLVLLDVMMPGMCGPDTLRAIRAVSGLEELPVVFLTAKAMPAEVEEYLSLGALDVIPKPFDPMQLADRVRAIWQRRPGGGA